METDLTAVFSLPKRSNGLDLVFGATESKNSSNDSPFFAHISISVMIQLLKFGTIAMFDLVNSFNGLDLDLLSQILKKKN